MSTIIMSDWHLYPDETGILEDCAPDMECPDQCNKSSYSAELSYSALAGTSIQHELSKDGQVNYCIINQCNWTILECLNKSR